MIFIEKNRIFIRKVYIQGLFSLLFLVLTVGAGIAGQLDSPALMMPLAANSLILDLATSGPNIVAVGWRGHALISDDEAQTWQQVQTPTRRMLTGVYFKDKLRGWAVGHGAVILGTEDGGKSWQLLSSAPEEERPLFDIFVNDDYGFAIGAYAKFMTTEDGGKSWQPGDFVINKDPESLAESADGEEELPFDFHLDSIARSANGVFYIAAEAGYIFRSADAGHTWSQLPSPYNGSLYGVLPLEGETLLVYGLRGHIFRSEDGGQSWTEITTGTTALLTDATRLPDDTIVITGMAGVILTSADSGRNFTLHQPDRIALTSVVVTSPGTIVFAGERGFKSFKPADFMKLK
jgi:photosystem II stability/assembly factor-like uncharacterized protein